MPSDPPTQRPVLLTRPGAEARGIIDTEAPSRVLHRRFRGEALAVRAALRESLAALAPHLPSAELRGTVEIVLAEVLNNIVEHAYGNTPGPVELQLRPGPRGLEVFVADEGRPFPQGHPPRPDTRTTGDALPEGGFGWPLIHSLTRDIAYRRHAGRNELRFRLSTIQSGAFD